MIAITPDLLTHVAEIDEQHKELFDRINAVELELIGAKSITKEAAQKTLDFLGSYIIEHFGFEEELQRKSGYPKYGWHRAMHQWYIAEFRKVKEEYEKNGPSEAFTLLLDRSIKNWISKHIRNVDTEFGKYLNARKK